MFTNLGLPKGTVSPRLEHKAYEVIIKKMEHVVPENDLTKRGHIEVHIEVQDPEVKGEQKQQIMRVFGNQDLSGYRIFLSAMASQINEQIDTEQAHEQLKGKKVKLFHQHYHYNKEGIKVLKTKWDINEPQPVTKTIKTIAI